MEKKKERKWDEDLGEESEGRRVRGGGGGKKGIWKRRVRGGE